MYYFALLLSTIPTYTCDEQSLSLGVMEATRWIIADKILKLGPILRSGVNCGEDGAHLKKKLSENNSFKLNYFSLNDGYTEKILWSRF